MDCIGRPGLDRGLNVRNHLSIGFQCLLGWSTFLSQRTPTWLVTCLQFITFDVYILQTQSPFFTKAHFFFSEKKQLKC